VTVIGILYGLIGLAIRRSTLLTRVGSDASAPAGVMVQGGGGGGGGARVERMLRVAGGAEQQRAQQLQTRARLAVVKMLGTCAHASLSLSLSLPHHIASYTQGEVTLRPRYDRHFVGITWHNVWS